MNLTRLAIRNSQFVVIILLILILLGVRSFLEMPRSEDPQVDFPIYIATVVYPGTSPEDMETLIVDPLEEAINEVNDITQIKTDIREGVAVIAIDAKFGIDTEKKLDDILREINKVRGSLPSGIALFDIQQIKPEDRVNFLVLALTSDVAPYSALNDLAEDIKKDLEDIDGINKVNIDAFPAEEVRVSLDYERLASLNINLGQVVNALRTNNINVPGGDVSAGNKNFTIKSTGGFDNLNEIKNTIVGIGENQIIKLRDIAEVTIENQDLLWKAEYNGEKAIYVSSKMKRGYNIVTVDEKCQQVIENYRSKLPPNVKLNVAFEQTSGVKAKINDFFTNLIQGVALVGIVMLLFLGWRAALIIITVIPICIILSLAILNSAGYGLQQISIASLVLALGLLVDNGIVVIENITQFIKDGFSKKEAALKGASEVSVAIFASTITTLLSFFPLTQLGEGAGLFLKSLPLTVIFTLVISLILALTFSPIMSNWVLSNRAPKVSVSDRLFKTFNQYIYEPTLRFALKFGWIIIIVAIGITVFSISLFPKIGVSFFPTADKPLLIIDINTPRGSSLALTEKAVNYVENLIDTIDLVDNYSSNLGNGSPQVYYNRIPVRFNKSHGQVVMNLKEWEQKSFYNLIGFLRKNFADYPGAKITVEELKNGAPVAAPIEIRLIGEDLKVLKNLGQKVESIFEKTEGVINIENPMRRNQVVLKIGLDKDKAGLLGIQEIDFDQTVRASLNGLQIDKVTLEDQEEYALVIRMPFDQAPSIADFDKIYMANLLGGQIPLSHIANVTFEGGPAEYSHYDLDRFIGITGSVINLDNTISTTLKIKNELEKIQWPDGYKFVIGGEYEEQQSTFGSLGIILILAQIAIFAVLVLQFRSILQPIIVFAAIPLAVSGSFIALYLTGWPFSFFAFVGMISLIGIVVNNSIILVDYINQLIAEGQELHEAIVLGSTRRFKPILLTSITTILGLVPLTLQGTNQWSPLCLTIIGGMVSSTMLTLIVVPVLYKWLTKEKNTTTGLLM